MKTVLVMAVAELELELFMVFMWFRLLIAGEWSLMATCSSGSFILVKVPAEQ